MQSPNLLRRNMMNWTNVTTELPSMDKYVFVKWHGYILHGYFKSITAFITPTLKHTTYTFKSVNAAWGTSDEWIALSSEMEWSYQVLFEELEKPKDKYIAITVNAD